MTQPRFEAIRSAPDLLEITIAGRLDARLTEVALTRLVDDMEGMHHAKVLIRDAGADWPSLGAIGVEMRHWVQVLAMVQKVDRVAILTDQAWLRRAATVESALVPNLVIHSFAPDAEGEARTWLSGGAPGVMA